MMHASALTNPSARLLQRARLFSSVGLRRPSAPPLLTASPGRRVSSQRTCQAAASGAGEAGASDEGRPQPGLTQSGEWKAVSLPYGVPTAGAVFFLAGFLKLLIMCFPYSTISIMMYSAGRADLGYWAVMKMLPLSLGLVALAKTIIDRKLLERRLVRWAIVLGSIAALILSRLLFYSPGHRPDHPLSPMIRAQQQQRAAYAAAAERHAARQQAVRERALKGPMDAKEFAAARERALQLGQGQPQPPR